MSIQKSAIFSDETGLFRIPMEPEVNSDVTIRLRAKKGDSLRVFLIHENSEVEMAVTLEDELFAYFETVVEVGETAYKYYFEIEDSEELFYYGKTGFTTTPAKGTEFVILPGFSTPDWAKGAMMYQIYIDRFANGDPANDVLDGEYYYVNGLVEHVDNWNDLPKASDVHRFYGGDLQGVIDKLPYLRKLNVEAIYFNPIFVSPSNHKYDAQDYDAIDPHLGTFVYDEGEILTSANQKNEKATRYINRVTRKENLEATEQLFIRLVEEAHSLGIRVILDGVFNHCGSFHKWMDHEKIYDKNPDYQKGAYLTPRSPYRNFFKFRSEKWPNNEKYEGWWNYVTLPKLNYEASEELQEYILNIGRKWVSAPYNCDGWRLDVAADLGHSEEFNHGFWKRFRKAVKEANPNALIIAEHYGSPENWLQGDEWDSVMNYDAFMEPVTWFLTGMEKHSDAFNASLLGNADHFFQSMNQNMRCYTGPSLYTAMNQLSNHDHSRFLTRTNRMAGRLATKGAMAAGVGVSKPVLREAILMQMSWPGMPTIYYGDEVGVVGWTDPDSRRTFPWGREDLDLLEYSRYIGSLHHRYKVLKNGSYKPLTGMHQMLAYARFNEEEQAVVLVNNDDGYRRISVPVWEAGVMDGVLYRVMETSENGYNVGVIPVEVKDGHIDMELSPHSAVLLVSHKH